MDPTGDAVLAFDWLPLALGGLAGGLGMLLVLLVLGAVGVNRLPAIRYAGSLVTGRSGEAGAAAAGVGVWIVASLLFGFLYALAFSLLGWSYGSVFSAVMLGTAIGLVHGLVGGMALPGVDFLHRPVRRGEVPALGRFGMGYGGGSALALLTGHVVFGAVFGWIYGLFLA